MKNWKTTVSGILASAGLLGTQSTNHTIQIVGQILSALGVLLLGVTGKDSNVTGGTVSQN
jgi:hypothetical protein